MFEWRSGNNRWLRKAEYFTRYFLTQKQGLAPGIAECKTKEGHPQEHFAE
jgi:hypothetical protein